MYICRATEVDVVIIHTIGCQSYRANFGDIWSNEGIEQHLRQGFSQRHIATSLADSEKNHWLLAGVDQSSNPVGFATLIENSKIPNSNQVGLELQKLYFLSAASGRGFGRGLMNHILTYAQQQGYTTIWLDVLKSNHGGIRFYQAHGFEQKGELPFKTDQQNVGQWVMVKTL